MFFYRFKKIFGLFAYWNSLSNGFIHKLHRYACVLDVRGLNNDIYNVKFISF